MATRRERFLKMRDRHLRRARKHFTRGWKWELQPHRTMDGFDWYRTERKWSYEKGGKMAPLDLKQASFTHAPLLEWPPDFIIQGVHPITRTDPPHPYLSGWPYLWTRANGSHPRFAFHGWFRRRVIIFRRPAGRMRGDQRKIWVANQIYIRHGWFPDWDILGRTPTQTQVTVEGVEAVEDAEWPGGMTPPP